MRIARVFPRKTRLSPVDALTYFGPPGFLDEADEVHISTAFTYDLPQAEWLEKQWKHVAPVKHGGPAHGRPSSNFVPGKYLQRGCTITSRGCPNKCWHCSVWKREPSLIELPIMPGWNVLDDNILACSERHIIDVFAMLAKQNCQARFTGGLEAARLRNWHVHLLSKLHPDRMYFAYDTPDDLEPLIYASKLLREAGFTNSQMKCYVLVGYKRDTFSHAEDRLRTVAKYGYDPMAMLYRNFKGNTDKAWQRFSRTWARPALYRRLLKKI